MRQSLRGKSVILYHGTSLESLDEIMKSGYLDAPVFLTPQIDAAWDYAFASDSPVVLAVSVSMTSLELDFDTTNYDPDVTLEEAISNGQSVFSADPIDASSIVDVYRNT